MSRPPIPVSFANGDRLRLFGILHEPETRRAEELILLLSPGVKMRVAPHRLYNKMAARFVALGYAVLRFDFHGLGDSEGDAEETQLADLYRATQLGRYVSDTIAAMDWMQETYGYSRFIAAGLCGGALTGLLAAAGDLRIVGLLGLSIPVVLDGSGVDATLHMTAAQLEETRAAYLRKFKVWDPEVWRAWGRLLTLQSDYRLLLRSVGAPLRARLGGSRPTSAPLAAEPSDNTNPQFAPAFLRMVSTSRRVLLVFAEADRLFWEFDAKFMRRHAAAIQPYAPWFHVHVTRGANHIFSFAEWQAEMLDECCRWLGAAAAPALAERQGR